MTQEHFLITFFHDAKTDGKKTCLSFFHQDEYFSLPRWWVRSKVKHFALGLLHHQAKSGDNLYLSGHLNPNRIYAELAGILLGLRIVPLPIQINSAELSQLIKNYPPHYFYATPSFFTEHETLLLKQKSTKLWVSEPNYNSRQSLSFREVFNTGIIHESKHYQTYRTRHDRLGEEIISEVSWDKKQQLQNQALTWTKLAPWLQHWRILQKNNTNLWAQIDLSQNIDRIVGVYAPLALSQSCLCLPIQTELPKTLSRHSPHQIYLRPAAWQKLIQNFEATATKSRHFWKKLSLYRQCRRVFGKNLRQVWLPPSTELKALSPSPSSKISLSVVPD